ncbi:hypothetical protein Y032_0041g448 [Ancylostoma ceylanicum]|uniref:Uncharacterized protein n=1 Tax=Ancylostoma ceylanicum TaxID=53326 RepID=A0A016UGI4_9BILA|nr:hypothetical protein Y032_0041g448 [Ancylostoma ceylanicum]
MLSELTNRKEVVTGVIQCVAFARPAWIRESYGLFWPTVRQNQFLLSKSGYACHSGTSSTLRYNHYSVTKWMRNSFDVYVGDV